MSAAAPPPAPAAAAGAAAAAAGSPQVPSVLFGIINRIKEGSSNVLKQQKPWNEVLDRSVISRPENLGEAVTRIKKNAAYFRVNYFIVMLATCIVTFLMHPTSLIILSLLLASWVYILFIRQAPIEIGGRTLSDREKLMSMSAITFITIFFLTSVGTVFFSALALSTSVIVLHGAFREPDNLFVDEADSQQSIVSILTGKPATTGISAV